MSRCSFAQTSTDDASVACHPAHFLDIVKLLSRSAELARRTTLFHVKHHILLRAVCHPSAMPSTIVRSHMIGTDDRPGSPKPTHTAGLATITYQHPCWCPASVLMVTAPLAAGPQLTSDDYSLEIIYHKHRAIPRPIDPYRQRVDQVSALQTSMHLALDTAPGQYSCSTCVDAASVTYFDGMLQAPSGTITETMMQAI